MASRLPVAKLMRSQLYLTNSHWDDYDYPSEFSATFPSHGGARDDYDSSEFSATFLSHEAAAAGDGAPASRDGTPSSSGRRRCYFRSTKRSGGSFGEVPAAIPFIWEEAPGRPKVPRSRKNSRGSGGAVELFDNQRKIGSARSRPPLHARQSTHSFRWNERLLAEQLQLAAPSSWTLDNCKKLPAAGGEDPVLPLPPRLRATTKLIAPADSSDLFQQRYNRILGVQEGPLGSINGPSHRRTQSTMAYPTNRGHRRAWSLSYPIEQPTSKQASSKIEDCSMSAAAGDGSKDFWPSLKEKMRWRNRKPGTALHRYLARKFPQNVGGRNNNDNKCRTDHFHILDFSPQHPSSRFSDKVEKENDDHYVAPCGDGGGLSISSRRTSSFRNTPRSRKPKSSSRSIAAPSSTHFSTRSSYPAPPISRHDTHYITEFRPATGIDRRFDRAITFPASRKHRSALRSNNNSYLWLSPLRWCYSFNGLKSGDESP